MRYVLAGKTETYLKYINDHKLVNGRDVVNVRREALFNQIGEKDTIVLLRGWWAKEWAKQSLKNKLADYPHIEVEYLDGKFGEDERKTLKSDSIHDRFEILDL